MTAAVAWHPTPNRLRLNRRILKAKVSNRAVSGRELPLFGVGGLKSPGEALVPRRLLRIIPIARAFGLQVSAGGRSHCRTRLRAESPASTRRRLRVKGNIAPFGLGSPIGPSTLPLSTKDVVIDSASPNRSLRWECTDQGSRRKPTRPFNASVTGALGRTDSSGANLRFLDVVGPCDGRSRLVPDGQGDGRAGGPGQRRTAQEGRGSDVRTTGT